MEQRPPPKRDTLPPPEPVSAPEDGETRFNAEETPTPVPQDHPESEEWHTLGKTHVAQPVAGPSGGRSPSGEPAPPSSTPASVSLPGPASPEAEQGAVLGDFRLLQKLGEGAMGAVYRAYQISFERQVAVKILFKHIASNARLVQRLYREGLAMGQLDHPNIVAGYGVGEVEGWHYVALRFVDGESLAQWLARLGRLKVSDAVHIALVCARALHYAHEHGLIHRDIKPDNILVTRMGHLKIADLGMVKGVEEDMALTQTGHAVGTPWYMPLEQAKNSKDIDARSDVYALGCTLYCLLTGNPPFAGPTLLDVIGAKEQGTFPLARNVNPEVPERLDLIIAKMAAKHARYRYQSCADVIADLEALDLDGESLEFIRTPDSRSQLQKRRTDVNLPTLGAKTGDTRIDDVWYLRCRSREGESVVRKVSTA